MAGSTRRPLQIERPFPVRTYDIDFAGHVSNLVYVRWLEDLRLAMLEAYLPLSRLLGEGRAPVLGMTHIEYKRPILLFDEVVGRMWVDEMGRAKLTLGAEFSANGNLAATATQAGVFVDLATKKPTEVPRPLRKLFEEAAP